MDGRMWGYLAIIFLLVSLAGCNLAPLLGPGQAPQQQALLVETEVVAAPERCRVVVTVNRPAQDLLLDVTVFSEPGIRFAATGALQSETQTVAVQIEETTELSYDCYLAPDEIQLPGAYAVRATAFHNNTSQLWKTTVDALYVYADSTGRRQLMAGADAFAGFYGDGYVAGVDAISYHVALEEAPYPSRGLLHLRVDSRGNSFAPTLGLRLGAGVQFVDGTDGSPAVRIGSSQTARITLPPIAEGGSRIVTVPFRMAPNSLPGEYSLRVEVHSDAGQWAEVAPVFVAVRNNLDHPQSAWLDQVPRRPMTVAPALGGLPATECGGGGAAPPTLPPPSATATAPAPVPAWPEQRASLVWDNQLSGFYGNRWQLWEQIGAQVPISWEQFKADVAYHNPHLAADGYVFLPEKTYVIPRAAAYDATAQ